jgi:hypothetical protein
MKANMFLNVSDTSFSGSNKTDLNDLNRGGLQLFKTSTTNNKLEQNI